MATFEHLHDETADGSKASSHGNEISDIVCQEETDSFYDNWPVTLSCDPCQFDEANEIAVGFCTVCLEYLCNNCIKEHKKAKMTRGHSILLENFPKKPTVLHEIRKLTLCPFHKDMNIAYRCDDHDVLACISCKAEKHRKCVNVFEIGKSKGSETVVKNAFDSLRAIEDTSKNVRKMKKENITHLYEEQSKILNECKTYCEEIINRVKHCQEQVEMETKEKIENAVSEVTKDLDESVRLAESGAKDQELLNTAVKYMDIDMAVVIAHQINRKAKELRQNIDKLSVGGISVNFVKSQQVSDFPKLGNICIDYHNIDAEAKQTLRQNNSRNVEYSSDAIPDAEVSSKTNTCKVQTTSSATQVNVKSSLQKSAGFEHQYSIESNDSKFCSVLGSVIFPDGQLLIADIDNSKLKLLSAQFVLQSTLKLPGKPVRMCAIDNYSVAVSFESVKRINRYTIGPGVITYAGGFKTKLFNHGLAYNAGNIVALMSDIQYGANNHSREDVIEIHMMDAINGSVNETITDFRKTNNSEYILRDTQALHVTDRNELIVAEANRVTCFVVSKKNMQTIAKARTWYSCHGVIEKYGIENITSDSDSIYACTRKGQILQMSIEDYRTNRVIISDIGSSARTMSVDNRRGCIVVGCFNDNYIHVYPFI